MEDKINVIRNFHELSCATPQGELISMSDYKGKVVLVVNTATKCGLAPQFEGLENLHQKYKDKGLVVLGFPCDQFRNQEPETNQTIVEVCKINHGVNFQLFGKIKVNGKDTHPVFRFLKNSLGSGIFGKKIKWNFTKFLIDADGNPVKRYSPLTLPEKIEEDIVALL